MNKPDYKKMHKEECRGKLEVIAETDTQETCGYCSLEAMQKETHYIACSKCDKIYQETTKTKGYLTHGGFKPRKTHTELLPYEGLLTREQLIEFAWRFKGAITKKQEMKIIGNR